MIEETRSLWRSLPLSQRLRQAMSPLIWGGLDRFFELKMRRGTPNVLRGTVKVAGYFAESHGIAASAKRCADALEKLNLPVERVDLGAPTHVSLLQRPKQRFAPGGAWIFHVNPPELVVALACVGEDALKQAFVAGYWSWELPRAPTLWLRRKALVDEVWTPSTHTAQALKDNSVTPVRVVPHPIGLVSDSDLRIISRQRLQLPATKFIAATLFDFRSSFARKNPLGAINAFREAFGEDPTVMLVVKAQHGNFAPAQYAELAQAAAAANIAVIDEIWSDSDAKCLASAADVLLSLHRAEGFGLTLAEAMAAGTPVIATGWSGNTELMSDYGTEVKFTPRPIEDPQGIYSGQDWAEPDIAHAAALLRRLRADHDWRQSLIARGRRLVEQRLSLGAYRASLGRAFAAAIED